VYALLKATTEITIHTPTTAIASNVSIERLLIQCGTSLDRSRWPPLVDVPG